MNKTIKLVTVFGALCLLAAVNYVVASPATNYVGVKAGDSFEFSVTVEGTMYSNPWPGSYSMTMAIDNVTDNSGNASVGVHMIIKNATWTANTTYFSFIVKESDTNTSTVSGAFVINKNIVNKTISSYSSSSPGNLQWVNATWDGNGVMQQYSMLIINSGVVAIHVVYFRWAIPGYPTLLVFVFAAAAVGLLTKKKLRSAKVVF